MMAIHIIFTNGSNPFLRYGMTAEEFARELLKWTKNYNLEYTGTTGGNILQFAATERNPVPVNLF